MNISRLIPYILFSYFFALTNTGFSQCETDTIPPTCIAPPDIQISTDTFGLYLPLIDFYQGDLDRFGLAESMDNCNAKIIELEPMYPDFEPINFCAPDQIIRRFIAIDESGNQSKDTCRQLISIDKGIEKIIQLPSLFEPYQSFLPSDDYRRIGDGYFILTEYPLNNTGENDTSVNYLALNWCSPLIEPESAYFLPVFDIDGDGRKGDAYTLIVANDSLYFQRPNLPDSVIAFPNQSWRYTLNQPYEFSGNVFTDLNNNCERELDENGITNFQIKIHSFPSGEVFETSTDSIGNYNLSVQIPLSDTLFEIGYTTALNLGQGCGNTFTTPKPEDALNIQQDFAISLVQDCPQIAVDIGAIRLRRCFTNTYFVNYFNYSTQDIEGVSIEVELDPFLLYENSTIPANAIGNNRYQFAIGTLQSGVSGQFRIDVLVSCESALGQTHCSKANVFPALICEPINPAWSGASIQLDAECVGETIQFIIKNTGDGSMTNENSFVVTEDVLMLRQGTFQLSAQESLSLTYPANGATYRLAAEQAKNHPGRSQPSISIEGCGGINTTGLVTAFPQDDQDLNVSIDCQENIGSYDPNDKSATPSGWGVENYLAKNTDIDYKIRFQNTGTDTAFKVVIRDTISTFLDASTILPGAASHAYTYQQYLDDSIGLSIIQFTFEDILLPDSTTNLEGSNGFVKFKIAQQADLPNGVRLENKAAIYFDFNEPIITNTTFHTIGEPFGRIISSTNEISYNNRKINIQPNPFNETAELFISGAPIKEGTLRLFDLLGREVQQQSFLGNQIHLQRSSLLSGFYLYAISVDNQLIATGKMQVSQK